MTLNPFSINLSDANRDKINTALTHSIGSTFILFPEYTYNSELQEQYQNYCNENNCIIIGGSGLESVGANYYAYAPVFIPNKELIKVYKRHITPEEKIYSNGRILPYPQGVQRQIRLEGNEIDIVFSVFVCYDFIVENITERHDIVFVPQYEQSPQQFISEGDKISKGWRNFVLGANNSNDNQRSLGFAILNRAIITALSANGLRDANYQNAAGEKLNHHHTIVYDTQGEKITTFQLNLATPYSLAFNFSLNGGGPIVIPIANHNL
ncbi:MAG: hypothetical protein CVT94_16330 [Bacteroidetes bacterium HGW-Bacteroidetes-11]|nr:MAG: hypothetical protein CVT94_16330 [Bacteroidetes bacterium HGW-Bacteroidetes-11]